MMISSRQRAVREALPVEIPQTGRMWPAVEHTELILAPITDVFAAVSTADGMHGWFAGESRMDPRPGGRVSFRWSDPSVDPTELPRIGEVIAHEPHHHFAFSWSGPEALTVVEFHLMPHGPGTMITVRESGFPRTDSGLKALIHCASGWGEALMGLKWYLEG